MVFTKLREWWAGKATAAGASTPATEAIPLPGTPDAVPGLAVSEPLPRAVPVQTTNKLEVASPNARSVAVTAPQASVKVD